jgi:hypothetical protein
MLNSFYNKMYFEFEETNKQYKLSKSFILKLIKNSSIVIFEQ